MEKGCFLHILFIGFDLVLPIDIDHFCLAPQHSGGASTVRRRRPPGPRQHREKKGLQEKKNAQQVAAVGTVQNTPVGREGGL